MELRVVPIWFCASNYMNLDPQDWPPSRITDSRCPDCGGTEFGCQPVLPIPVGDLPDGAVSVHVHAYTAENVYECVGRIVP
jgi:hypothetical protein